MNRIYIVYVLQDHNSKSGTPLIATENCIKAIEFNNNILNEKKDIMYDDVVFETWKNEKCISRIYNEIIQTIDKQ